MHSPLTTRHTDSETSHRFRSPVSPRTAGGASLLAWVCMAGSRVRSGELGGRENTMCCGRERRTKGAGRGANPPAVKVRAGPGAAMYVFMARAEPRVPPGLHGGVPPTCLSAMRMSAEGDSARWPPGTRIRGSWRRRPHSKRTGHCVRRLCPNVGRARVRCQIESATARGSQCFVAARMHASVSSRGESAPLAGCRCHRGGVFGRARSDASRRTRAAAGAMQGVATPQPEEDGVPPRSGHRAALSDARSIVQARVHERACAFGGARPADWVAASV